MRVKNYSLWELRITLIESYTAPDICIIPEVAKLCFIITAGLDPPGLLIRYIAKIIQKSNTPKKTAHPHLGNVAGLNGETYCWDLSGASISTITITIY